MQLINGWRWLILQFSWGDVDKALKPPVVKYSMLTDMESVVITKVMELVTLLLLLYWKICPGKMKVSFDKHDLTPMQCTHMNIFVNIIKMCATQAFDIMYHYTLILICILYTKITFTEKEKNIVFTKSEIL